MNILEIQSIIIAGWLPRSALLSIFPLVVSCLNVFGTMFQLEWAHLATLSFHLILSSLCLGDSVHSVFCNLDFEDAFMISQACQPRVCAKLS